MTLRRLVFLLLVLTLAGCARATPYQRASTADVDEVGYLDRRLAADRYLVGFLANCHTSRARAFDFTLLRAAEIGVREGFPYFTIRDRKEDTAVIDLGWSTYGSTGNGSFNAITRRDMAECPAFALTIQYFRARPHQGLELLKSGETALVLSQRYGVRLAF